MTDLLIRRFFEKERWEQGIQKSVEKDMKASVLKNLCLARTRADIYRRIRDGQYRISPPHEALIPKDNGDFRTVYVNESQDRVILTILNDMLFQICPENIHPNCLSYQTGIGCGKIVKRVSRKVQNCQNEIIGVKIDLSKYFDSVPIEYIDKAFDDVEKKHGKSAIIDMIRAYYHDDTVLDLERKPITKYSSLRQGCAVAAYLADVVLFHIDSTISSMNVCYYRYSDDILIIGKDWERAYQTLQQMLADMGLKLNPKKVEILQKHKWFKFLGFQLKNDRITLSESRVKTFQKEITARTKDRASFESIIRSVNHYLYCGDGEHCWADSVLSVINCEKDINTLNSFVMDACRAGATQKFRIGGLGCNTTGTDACITRGKGRHVSANRQKFPYLPKYLTLNGYRKSAEISKQAARVFAESLT